jgi:putative transposase
MLYAKVYIHCVWSTKYRIPFLNNPDLRLRVWQHIKENSIKKGIFIDFVNGYSDHCHCLISLDTDQTISKVIQLIKGESSYWINKMKLTKLHFAWQEEYFAIGVSESRIEVVRNYIKRQESHHTKKTRDDEFTELIEKHGFVRIQDE